MAKTSIEKIPEEYRPLSMWAYFGYSVLYSIPFFGWIFLVVFSLDNSNINRRNFSRSYFVIFIILAIFLSVTVTTGLAVSLLKDFIK